jgi:hypothetical protein
MKVVGSETIRYVMGLGEHSSVSGWRALYVYLGSEKLVEYRSNSTRFFHNCNASVWLPLIFSD